MSVMLAEELNSIDSQYDSNAKVCPGPSVAPRAAEARRRA
jgi:hypothetical protein